MLTEEYKKILIEEYGYKDEDFIEYPDKLFLIDLPKVEVRGTILDKNETEYATEHAEYYIKDRLTRFTSIGLVEFLQEIEYTFNLSFEINEEQAYELLTVISEKMEEPPRIKKEGDLP